MSESMRLANEYKADRVDQFYAALHESRFWHKAVITTVLIHVRFWGQSGLTRT